MVGRLVKYALVRFLKRLIGCAWTVRILICVKAARTSILKILAIEDIKQLLQEGIGKSFSSLRNKSALIICKNTDSIALLMTNFFA
jgi:hypothetical protein